MSPCDRRKLYLRWVGVNSLGEMVGLGLTFAVGTSIISTLGEGGGIGVVLISFGVAVASGAIEATIVRLL